MSDEMPLCECGCGEPVSISKSGPRRGQPNRFVHGHNIPTGSDHRWWKGGRRVGSNGYVSIYRPDHHRAGSNGYVKEHVFIAEKALGKPIPKTCPIHHVNDDRADNSPGNLVVCEDDAYHKLLHARARALRATGNPDARRCHFCGEWGDPEDMYISDADGRRHPASHPACDLADQRQRRAEGRM